MKNSFSSQKTQCISITKTCQPIICIQIIDDGGGGGGGNDDDGNDDDDNNNNNNNLIRHLLTC